MDPAMDEIALFKDVGDVKLTVPVLDGFDKLLFDFVQITVAKSGFKEDESDNIAARISQKVFQQGQMLGKLDNHQQVTICVSHRPRQISVRIELLGLTQEELFDAT